VDDGKIWSPQVSKNLRYRTDNRILIPITGANRKRVFLCLCCGVFAQFSGTSLTGYYLHNILEAIGIDSPKYQNKLNGFILMVNMIEAWTFASMVDRFGRRPLFLVSPSKPDPARLLLTPIQDCG